MLIQLQEVDTKIRTLVARKNQLPEMLAELERRRTASQDNLGAVKEALQSAQKNKREQDQALETGLQKVEKLKARTSEIKNNKEYQAMLKEIELAEQENKTIEDEILVLMEKTDTAVAAITAAEKNSRDEEVNIAAEQKAYQETMKEVDEELRGLEKGKQEIIGHIDPAVFSRYQRLLRATSGTAIVEIRGESCSGCFMSIPPQVFVNVKKNEEIIACPQCNRILYFKDVIEQKDS
jgi:uncharacterized protein